MNFIEPENNNKELDGLHQRYSRKYPLCGKIGKTFSYGRLKINRCMKWRCIECFPKLRFLLFLEILKNIYAFDMDKHFIITFEGKKLRNKISAEESFKFMNKQWDKFSKVIKRRYPDFKYILLPRSQKNGYCHYHIITNQYIPWEFLDKKRKKYDLGFVSIQKNKSVAEYLHTDFFKDGEWVIPLNIRHVRSSRDIKLRNLKKPEDFKFFDNTIDFETIIKEIKKEFLIDYDYLDYWEDNNVKQAPYNKYAKWEELAPGMFIQKLKPYEDVLKYEM
jgi:hypothetical protein